MDPRFIISLFTPDWYMLFTPAHEPRLDFCCLLKRGINEHLHVLLACHQGCISFHSISSSQRVAISLHLLVFRPYTVIQLLHHADERHIFVPECWIVPLL